jgi:hypothetical protein
MVYGNANPLRRKVRKPYKIDVNNPQAAAVCDGCGFQVNRSSLTKHMQYKGGMTPQWDGLLVCGTCDDVPQPYFKRLVLFPDPVPVVNPRPEAIGATYSGYGYLVTENGQYLADGPDFWLAHNIVSFKNPEPVP